MKIILPAILIAIIFTLSGCSSGGNSEAITELEQKNQTLQTEIEALSQATSTLQNEINYLQRTIRITNEITAPLRLSHGLYADEVKAAFLENEELLAEIAEIAGLWPGFQIEPVAVTDNHLLFARGLVSYWVDRSSREITWQLEAYRLDWMGWRHVREAPTPRRLTDSQTVAIRNYSVDDATMAVYHQSTLEVAGEDLWHELTQIWGIKDIWYVGDILHVDFHPRMEMAFNIGLGSLPFAEAMIHTLFSLPNVAEMVFTLDGGPMMHGYLGFCLRERRIAEHRGRYMQIAGHVISMEGSRDSVDGMQIYVENEEGNTVILFATARTAFPLGKVEAGDFITGFINPMTGTDMIAYVIIPGAPDGVHVGHFVSGLGTLSGYYVSVDKDFVFAVNEQTIVTYQPMPEDEQEWHGNYMRWRLENTGFHNFRIVVIYSESATVNGRQHVVARELFVF